MHALSPVSISVDFSLYHAHLFKVTMQIDGASAHQKLSMPVWTPGSYMVREFAQHIVAIEAFDGKNKVAVRKIDKNCFEVNNTSPSVTINYQVYGFDSSIRAAFIDDSQAFFNGCAMFLRPHGLEHAPFLVRVLGASVPAGKNWQVATGMPAVDVDTLGFGSYQAASYDELVDYPFQVSDMKRLSFKAKGVPHEFVMVGDHRPCHEEKLTRDLSSLCENHINLFGGTAPFSSYTFLARFEEGGYGGLEHRNSTMVISSPYGLPKCDGEPDAHYRTMLGLLSHEYFHSWNIKRLKPKNFIPFDYDNEVYTTMLWLFEGVTSYYDDLALPRANLISVENYLDMMGKNYGKLLRNSGRQRQTLAAASFDAWIKFYRPNENSNNVTTSYYLNGSFIALYLDLLIREKNQDRISLDDVMRKAFEQFGESGITEEEFFALLENIGGINSVEIKEKFIYGNEDTDLVSMLARIGVELKIQEDEYSADDRTKMQAYVGVRYRFDDNARAIITQIDYDSPAAMAGLCPLDEIVAINNIRLDLVNAQDLLASIRVDEMVDVLYVRKKMIKTASVRPSALPKTRASMMVSPSINDDQKRRLLAWLKA